MVQSETGKINIRFLAGIFLILVTQMLNAQDSPGPKNWGQIGITYSSFGNNDVFRNDGLMGEASYTGKQFYTLGINYLRPVNHWIDLETGLEYSKHTILIGPNLPPDADREPYKAKFSLINIPMSLRANFLKFFFFNSGLFLDIDANKSSSIDNQTGIGGLLGLGARYHLKCGASIFINPYFKLHALIPFSPDDNQQKVYESGVRVGLAYQLKRKQ